MKWKFSEWGDNWADLSLEFSEGSQCDIVLKISGIPESDKFGSNVHVDSIKAGWKENIFKRIHLVFGYPLKRD